MLISLINYHAGPGKEHYRPDANSKNVYEMNEADIVTGLGRIPAHDPKQPREKILVYYAWPFMKPVILNILGFHGIEERTHR